MIEDRGWKIEIRDSQSSIIKLDEGMQAE